MKWYYPYFWIAILKISTWLFVRIDTGVNNLGCIYLGVENMQSLIIRLAYDVFRIAIVIVLSLMLEIIQMIWLFLGSLQSELSKRVKSIYTLIC